MVLALTNYQRHSVRWEKDQHMLVHFLAVCRTSWLYTLYLQHKQHLMVALFPGRVFAFMSDGRTTRPGISCLRMRQITVVRVYFRIFSRGGKIQKSKIGGGKCVCAGRERALRPARLGGLGACPPIIFLLFRWWSETNFEAFWLYFNLSSNNIS